MSLFLGNKLEYSVAVKEIMSAIYSQMAQEKNVN
jgi:hypothetical protein